MNRENLHHKSKKKRYSLILIPDEDASKAKNFKLALWQLITALSLLAIFSAVFFILILSYTPIGDLLPLSNPRIENKYNKELVALNNKMMKMMENLVELRAYNVKLRQVLGENVSLNDSGEVRTLSNNAEKGKNANIGTEKEVKASQFLNLNQGIGAVRQINYDLNTRIPVSFPAILPVEGYITRGFEPEKNHFGLDIAGKIGSVISATAEGSIIFAGWTFDYGYVVIISHANGFLSFYKHNQSLLKTTGSFVYRGEPIAMLGNTGATSTGPHLHFEVWKDGVPVDPSTYLINLYF